MKASSLAKKMLREFPEEVQNYFFYLDKKCQKNNITLRLSSGFCVNNVGRCSGYFDSLGGELAVALKRGWEHSFAVAIHESAHLDQKNDFKSIWHSEIAEEHSLFFQWLGGKNFKNPEKFALSAMLLERDCERRALKLIRQKYSHLIDPEKYILRSNCYLAGHAWILKNRRWFRKSPYVSKLMAHCPSKLIKSFDDIPENLTLAMDRFL
jgi:hypothetical protein